MVRLGFWLVTVFTVFPLDGFATSSNRLCPFLIELSGTRTERAHRFLARMWGVDTGFPSLCPACSVPNFQTIELTATIPQAEANGAPPAVKIGSDEHQRPTVEFTVSVSVAASALDQAVRATIESASTGGAAAAYNAAQNGPVTEEAMGRFSQEVVELFEWFSTGSSSHSLAFQRGELTQLSFLDYGPSGTLCKTYFSAQKNPDGTIRIIVFPLSGMTSVMPIVLAENLRNRLTNLSVNKGLIYASTHHLKPEGSPWSTRLSRWLKALEVPSEPNTIALVTQNYVTQMKHAAIAAWWQERVAHPLIKSDPDQKGINSEFLWELTKKIEGLDIPWPELAEMSKSNVRGRVAVPLTSLQDLAKLITSAPGPKKLKDQLVAAFETESRTEMAKPSPILVQTMIPTLFKFNQTLGVILKPTWSHQSKVIAKFNSDGTIDVNSDALPQSVEIEIYSLGEGFTPESQVGMIHSLLEHFEVAP